MLQMLLAVRAGNERKISHKPGEERCVTSLKTAAKETKC